MFNMFHRYAPYMPITNVAQLVNLLGIINSGERGTHLTPTALVYQLYTAHAGAKYLRSTVDCLKTPLGKPLPLLDVSATRDDDRAAIFLVNRHYGTDMEVTLDLDGFKSVNDSYGHDFGDQVLRAVFNVVSVGIRSSDFIARYGGDELTLILAKSDVQAARLVTEKILENIAKFSYKAPNGRAIKLGISGGIAIYPNHGRSGPELLRAADAALYDAKKHHRGTFQIAKAATGPLDPLTLSRKVSGGE